MPHFAQIFERYVYFDYSESTQSSQKYDLHCHNFYELYYFVQGDVDYLVEGRHYRPTPHSMLLLAPNLFHGVRVNSEAPYRRFSFHFNPNCLSAEPRELLLSLFPSPQEPEYSIYFEGLDQKQVPAFFEALAECAHLKGEMQKALLPILAEALLSKLLMVCHTAPEHPTVLPPSATIIGILDYLNTHLSEPISLDGISEKFYISKHHLNKVFRKAIGTTVGDYLLHKRVTHAQILLLGGETAANAATASGFSDYSAFFRAYKRIIGHSPLQDKDGIPFQPMIGKEETLQTIRR